MKILMIGDGYVPITDTKVLGGAEKVTLDMSEALKLAGHEVVFCLPSDSTLKGFEIEAWDSPSKHDYIMKGEKPPRNLNQLAVASINKALANDNFDLIINHHKQPFVIKHLAKLNIPKISYIHNQPGFGLLSVNTNEAYAEFAKSGGICLGVSGWATRMNNNLVSGCVTGTHIIQIAMKKFEAQVPEYDSITIGRFVDWKNIHLAVWNAFDHKDENHVIIGYPSAPDEKYYVGQIKEFIQEIPNYHTGLTHLETMDYLSKSSIFIQTSHLETSSCTQFEASQRGVPSLIITKRNQHGSFEESFLTGMNEYYYELDTYAKRGETVVNLINTLVKDKLTHSSQLEIRQQLADYIYDRFNVEMWIKSFDDMLEKYGILK